MQNTNDDNNNSNVDSETSTFVKVALPTKMYILVVTCTGDVINLLDLKFSGIYPEAHAQKFLQDNYGKGCLLNARIDGLHIFSIYRKFASIVLVNENVKFHSLIISKNDEDRFASSMAEGDARMNCEHDVGINTHHKMLHCNTQPQLFLREVTNNVKRSYKEGFVIVVSVTNCIIAIIPFIGYRTIAIARCQMFGLGAFTDSKYKNLHFYKLDVKFASVSYSSGTNKILEAHCVSDFTRPKQTYDNLVKQHFSCNLKGASINFELYVLHDAPMLPSQDYCKFLNLHHSNNQDIQYVINNNNSDDNNNQSITST